MKLTLLIVQATTTFFIHGQNKLESSFQEKLTNNGWENEIGYSYEYNSNKNLISKVRFLWYYDVWKEKDKITYTYFPNNKVHEELKQLKNEGSPYFNYQKKVYFYNSAGLLYQILIQYWNGNAWDDSEKEVLTYNATNQFQSSVISQYTGAQWVSQQKYIASYTGNNLSQLFYEIWNGTQWELITKVFLDYNSDNEIISKYDKTKIDTAWVENKRTSYTVDQNFNRLTDTQFEFGIEDYKIVYHYDFSEELSNLSHPFIDKTGYDYPYEEYPYFNKIMKKVFHHYNNQTNSYIEYKIIHYFYDLPLPLSLDHNDKIQNISLYPNPSNDFIQLDGIAKTEKITIHNVSGIQVFEKSIEANEKINIQYLSNGLYFLKLENGNILKFVKK